MKEFSEQFSGCAIQYYLCRAEKSGEEGMLPEPSFSFSPPPFFFFFVFFKGVPETLNYAALLHLSSSRP